MCEMYALRMPSQHSSRMLDPHTSTAHHTPRSYCTPRWPAAGLRLWLCCSSVAATESVPPRPVPSGIGVYRDPSEPAGARQYKAFGPGCYARDAGCHLEWAEQGDPNPNPETKPP